MKLKNHEASEIKEGLKAVPKGIYPEESRKYEAESEEASEMRHQQQCILSGGVHLRHRLEKPAVQNVYLLCFSNKDTIPQLSETCKIRRSGVLACKKLSLHLTRNSLSH